MEILQMIAAFIIGGVIGFYVEVFRERYL